MKQGFWPKIGRVQRRGVARWVVDCRYRGRGHRFFFASRFDVSAWLNENENFARGPRTLGKWQALNQAVAARREMAVLQNLESDLRRIGAEIKVDCYPSVPAPMTAATASGSGLPCVHGIYFVWRGGVVCYVGRSKNINTRARTQGHHVIADGDWLSWVEVADSELSFAEAFYIGALRPRLNFGKMKRAVRDPGEGEAP